RRPACQDHTSVDDLLREQSLRLPCPLGERLLCRLALPALLRAPAGRTNPETIYDGTSNPALRGVLAAGGRDPWPYTRSDKSRRRTLSRGQIGRAWSDALQRDRFCTSKPPTGPQVACQQPRECRRRQPRKD